MHARCDFPSASTASVSVSTSSTTTAAASASIRKLLSRMNPPISATSPIDISQALKCAISRKPVTSATDISSISPTCATDRGPGDKHTCLHKLLPDNHDYSATDDPREIRVLSNEKRQDCGQTRAFLPRRQREVGEQYPKGETLHNADEGQMNCRQCHTELVMQAIKTEDQGRLVSQRPRKTQRLLLWRQRVLYRPSR